MRAVGRAWHVPGGDLFTGPLDNPRRYRVAGDAVDAPWIGGEGLTYRACEVTSGRPVALKMLTSLTRAEFPLLEARSRSFALISHPRLMCHREVFWGPALTESERPEPEDFDVAYSVADWVDGIPLAEAMPTPVDLATLGFLLDIGQGLHHLHGVRSETVPAGIVHRDVKPSNVRIGEDGHAVLLDFGIARPVEGDMTHAAGTFQWRAPEVLGGPGVRGSAIDLWGLGALGHWMLTGDPPALDGAASARERMRRGAQGAGLPRASALAGSLAQLLESAPEDRPPLGRWLQDFSALLAGGRGKRRYLTGTLAAAGVIAVGAIVTVALWPSGSPAPRSQAVPAVTPHASKGATVPQAGTVRGCTTSTGVVTIAATFTAGDAVEMLVQGPGSKAATPTGFVVAGAHGTADAPWSCANHSPGIYRLTLHDTNSNTFGNGTSVTVSRAAAQTVTEQEATRGANTFSNPFIASLGTRGPRVDPEKPVQVQCKLTSPIVRSAFPDGYWYLLADPPWNGQYYAVANTFWNGDKVHTKYVHNTDRSVPDC